MTAPFSAPRALPATFARRAGPALALGLGTLGAALAAPLLAVVGLAAGAAVLALLRPSLTARSIGAWPLVGLLAAGAAAGVWGVAGAVGAGFLWFLADTALAVRTQARRIAHLEGEAAGGLWGEAHLWLGAAFVAVMVAAQSPHVLLGLPLNLPHPPLWVVVGIGLAAGLSALDAGLSTLTRWRLGEAGCAPALLGAALHAQLLAAFVLQSDVSAGVLGLIAFRLALAAPTPSLSTEPYAAAAE